MEDRAAVGRIWLAPVVALNHDRRSVLGIFFGIPREADDVAIWNEVG